MRAIVYAGAGGTEVLGLREVPTPVPGPGQVLVRVAAAGLNRADIFQRRGRYPAPPDWPADIPGLEYSGTVAQLGEGVSRWKVGDKVIGLVGGGAQAEYLVVHEQETMALPESVPLVDGAAIPESFMTAWDALVLRGRARPGERVLIHAVASGLGTAAVQLVHRLGGISVGTSRTPSKLAQVKALGLDEAVDTSNGQGFAQQLSSPVDVILDVLGAPALTENLSALSLRGRLVLLGLLQGATAEVDFQPVLRNRIEIVGSVMRPRRLEERMPLVAAFSEEVMPWFTGTPDGLRPVIAERMPLERIADAHRMLEADTIVGKIVLTL
ncbi:MAG TPA: NAD(P)H-quinone oxidoreductase [Gemmatimonadales bacterium]|nr:NAD(P)H-quinone oxidoreductase [Gemmatimonadales bacterium]